MQLYAAGCRSGQRADAIRAAAYELGEIANTLIVRAVQARFLCKRRLPLNETVDLTIDQRIGVGDLEVIHDFAREAANEIERIADNVAGLLCDEPETLKRLAEMRSRQESTGKQWHGAGISGAIQETDATDRAGKEPRGPRQRQDRARRAKSGRPAKKRGRRC